ncbi:MAG: alpha/beta fold hydrolase [Candidatus Saccharimonadaceae bacterium]
MIKTFEIACDGYSIVADWYEGTSTNHVLLILQGYMSARSRQADFTSHMVTATGASSLVIDYTGHGDSPFDLKNTRPAQHLIEVIYAFEWITTNYPNAKISVIGSSYGSFLAAHLIRYKKVENLVFRAPAIYEPNTFYDLWSLRLNDEEAYREAIQNYRSDADELKKNPLFERMASSPEHVLVVVHENDEVIPRQTSDAYIRAFSADSFIVNGFSHAVSQSNVTKEQIVEYQERISTWVNQF